MTLARPWWRDRAVRHAPRPLDVVLVTLDTTRADRLGCYGGTVETPNLDGLARRGVRFTAAQSHVPLTCPSHASLMTGLIPARHGVHDNGGFVLGSVVPTLAERFVEAGYRTGAFVSAFVLDRRFGLARGFGAYDDDVLGGGRDNVEASVRGEVTVARAVEWIRADARRPIFAWVHLYDPHDPYDPPEPFKTRYQGREYEGEIAYMDAQVGVLLQAVAVRGRPALVVALADHGESLGEHGELTHSYFIYGATQRVPLLVSLPGWLPEGETVDTMVRLVDVMPTVLDVAGLPPVEGIDGRTLLPLMVGRTREAPGPVYQESYHPRIWWGAEALFGFRNGPWFYVKAPKPELYRVDSDPGETRNLEAKETAVVQEMDGRLQTMLASATSTAGRVEMDPDSRARLRALGYTAPGVQAATGRSLPDPKDNQELLAGVTRAADLASAGRKEEALALFRETLKLNPRSEAVRAWIASLLSDLQRHREAYEAFAALAADNADNENYALGMARALVAQHRPAEAADVLRSAVSRFPQSARLHEELGTVLEQLGQREAALQALGEAVSLAPAQAAAHLKLAIVLGKARRLRESGVELRKVVSSSPRSAEAKEAAELLAALGGSLLERNDLEEARLAYLAASEAGSAREDVYLDGALASYRLGRRAESLELLRRGVERLPQSAAMRYRLGRLLQEGGHTAEAEAAYGEALRLDPAHKQARAALDSLHSGAGAVREPRR